MMQSSPLPRIGRTSRALALAGCLLLILPQVVVIITSIDPNPAAIFPPHDFSLVVQSSLWKPFAPTLCRPASTPTSAQERGEGRTEGRRAPT